MTQPDQYFPDTAVNALSFADYSATTQTEWEDQIYAGVVSHFNVAEIAFEALLGWVEQIPIIGPIASDALAAAQSALAQLAQLIHDLLHAPASVLGSIFDAVIDGVNSIGDFLGGLFTGFGGSPGGGSGAGGAALVADVTAKAAAVTTTATTALETGESTIKGMFNEWYNTDTAEGTVDEVEQVFASVKASVAGGYTLQTFTASDSAWTVPDEVKAAAELYIGVFGGGGRGGVGGNFKGDNGVFREGGAGGSSGGYRVEKIDATTLGETLDIQVGAGATTPGADGGITSITNGSTVLVESVPGFGSIATPQGYIASSSTPGRGGKGGDATSGGAVTAGLPGEDSETATGGGGGAGDTHVGLGDAVADDGEDGGLGVTTALPMCGGAGGGGGGGARGGAAARGGDGGNGGVPGGGSGGGGAAVNSPLNGTDPGDPGVPGQGLAFLFYR